MDKAVESKDTHNHKKSNIFSDWIVPILVAIVLAFIINKFITFQVVIPSESMVPTLNEGDRLFVTRVYNTENLKQGDIVVFYSNEYKKLLIKRLIGLPGDEIVIDNGVVTRNGLKLKEDYVVNKDHFNGIYNVPEGEYFFLGDNRSNSADSRYWKDTFIKAKDIKAKAQIRVYPFTKMGKVE